MSDFSLLSHSRLGIEIERRAAWIQYNNIEIVPIVFRHSSSSFPTSPDSFEWQIPFTLTFNAILLSLAFVSDGMLLGF